MDEMVFTHAGNQQIYRWNYPKLVRIELQLGGLHIDLIYFSKKYKLFSDLRQIDRFACLPQTNLYECEKFILKI
jgi:hypothetical protein